MKKVPGPYSLKNPQQPPSRYDRPPQYDKMAQQRDIMVAMRDGVRLCVDVYRPDDKGKFPALLAIAHHNKDLQTPELCDAFGPNPAWSPFWLGAQEAGDTKFLTQRGYAHIVANTRGTGKSDDSLPPQKPAEYSVDWVNKLPWADANDYYDLVEWIAKQPWCDGNVGMIGTSGFANTQFAAAMAQPPHLKAIFPWDPSAAYMYRNTLAGGVIHVFWYLLDQLSVTHMSRGKPGILPPEVERLWQEAMNNPDYKMYNHLYNVLTQKGQHTPGYFNILLNPYDTEEATRRSDEDLSRIKMPFYTGAGWYCYGMKSHIESCQQYYDRIKGVPKKMVMTGPNAAERPWHALHDELLKWFDHWLKGIDTGILDEPPIKTWVMGANDWYYADDWPLPETRWTKYYLHSWERLREDPFLPSARDGYDSPDAFIQMPPNQTREVKKLRYMTDPLPEDTMIVGPISLTIYASIDQEDTNWIVALKDVGPDVSVRTARDGETMQPTNLPERELTRGWLKASHRALDEKRSQPWHPWHPFTREAQKPVVPGEITEYNIEILATANLFKKNHRICLDIMSMDIPTGSAGFTNVEYFPYHICSSKVTAHKIYHNEKYPSHLFLPVIPGEAID